MCLCLAAGSNSRLTRFAGAVAKAVFTVPVFFAGILFASEFRDVKSSSAALGANMLGAGAGGLLENLSLIFGMRALLLVAIVLYWHGWTRAALSAGREDKRSSS